jgi:DNA-binding transcriptional ArsR family regulator
MVTSVFDATVEPARRRILDLLIDGPRPVGDLVAGAGLSQPNTSRHLRVLREAGLVEVRPDGRRRLYALRPEGLGELERWLAPYRRMWRQGLAALEEHLDTKE